MPVRTAAAQHVRSATPTTAVALAGALLLLALLLPALARPAAAQEPEPSAALLLAGADEVASSIAWSQVTYTPLTGEVAEPPSEALLGRDDLFADNLAAGSLMGIAITNGRPLLLTPTGALDPDVEAELQRVLPDDATVTILGGDAAVNQSVEADLAAAGFTAERLEGLTRTETAAAIAATQDADTVLVVRSTASTTSGDATQQFADSLGAGALAAANGWEILFTQSDVLTGTTADALEAGGYTQAYAVGGPAAISDDVLADITAIVPGADRIAGATRFETAVELNELRQGTLGEVAIIVDGQAADAWADGFPAANLSGLEGYPLVLSNQGAIPAETRDYLEDFGSGTAFAAHFEGVSLVCGTTVDAATCAEALAAVNGTADGEVRPFPATDVEEPVEGNETATDAPELVRIDVEAQDATSMDVRFTFDEPLAGTPVPSCFHLYGPGVQTAADPDDDGCTDDGGGHDGAAAPDVPSADGDAAELLADEPAAVVVSFDLDEDEQAAMTLATVDFAAVEDEDGLANPEGDVAVGDAAVPAAGGTTDAPDLVGVEAVDANANTAVFVFDQAVRAVIATNEFQLIEGDGDVLRSDAAVLSTGDPTRVVVTFDDVANDERTESGVSGIEPTTAAALVRAGVLSGSVDDADGDLNPLQTIDIAMTMGTTTDPDLTAVAVDVAANTVTYTFDVDIALVADCGATIAPIIGPIPGTEAPETCVQVYDRDQPEVDATAVAVSATNARQLVATFADGVVDEAVGASVSEAVVTSTATDAEFTNEIDELPVAGPALDPGETAGPDLVAVDVTTADADTVVEYSFDEALAVVADDPDTADVDESALPADLFFIYDAAGAATEGTTAQVSADDPTVVQVTFEDEVALEAAVVATVDGGAVADVGSDADLNPEGAELLGAA